MNIPLINSYSEFQQRLGYTKLLLSVALRHSSDPDRMLRKLDGILFHPNADDTNTYLGELLGKVIKAKRRSVLVTRAAPEDDEPETSHLSLGNEAKQILLLTRALGLVDEKVVLLEDAMPLLRLLPDESWDLMAQAQKSGTANPLVLDGGTGRASERTFYLSRLLSRDIGFILLPSVLCRRKLEEFHRYVDWQGKSTSDHVSTLLTDAFAMIVERKPKLFGQIRNARELDNYFEGELRTRRAHPGMRQYARFRHQGTPRLEFLKELGILDASTDGSPYTYKVTAKTRAFAEYVESRVFPDLELSEFVGAHLFGLAHLIYGGGAEKVCDPEEIFSYFLRAYARLERQIGNTPASSISVLGCLLAQDDGKLIEIDTMYSVGRDYAARKYSDRVRYSGGSVQVRDYLISIDRRLLRERGLDRNAPSQE